MTVTTTNLLQGPASLWWGAFGVTEPAALTDAFGVGWTDLGGTKEGVSLTIADEYSVLDVDQLIEEVERRRIKRVLSIKTSLAEATLENLARAINNTQPASSELTPDTGTTAYKPAYSAIGLEGLAPGGFKRRFILRKALSTESVELAHKKDGQTLIPVTFTGHYVSNSIKQFYLKDATS